MEVCAATPQREGSVAQARFRHQPISPNSSPAHIYVQMNKDEAEKCLDLARKFRLRGDYDKAIKFFDKSLRLYPLPGVKELKERVEAEQAEQARAAAGGDPTAGSGGGNSNSGGSGEARRRHPVGASARGGGVSGVNGQAPSSSGTWR